MNLFWATWSLGEIRVIARVANIFVELLNEDLEVGESRKEENALREQKGGKRPGRRRNKGKWRKESQF
jgi:hypothetical protein